MKWICSLIAVVGASTLYAGSTPYAEARELSIGGKVLGRGVAGFGRTSDGTHWFYSHAVVKGGKVGNVDVGPSETSIESWSTPEGRPIKAIYRARTETRSTTTTVTVKEDKVVMEQEVDNGSGPASKRTVTVAIPAGAAVQMSQFNPLDIHMPDGEEATSVWIVEPTTLSASEATLQHVVSGVRRINGQPVGQENRYQLTTGAGTSIIRVDENGRLIWTMNDQGMVMQPTVMLPQDRQELASVVARMGE